MSMLFDESHDQKLKPVLYPAKYAAAQSGQVILDTSGYSAVVGYIVSGTITDGTNYPFIVEVGNSPTFANAGEPFTATDLTGNYPLLLVDLITPDGAPSDQDPGTVAALATESLTFAQATDSNKVRRFGYVGPYRYVRVSLQAPTGTPSTGGVFGAFIELTRAARKPVVQD